MRGGEALKRIYGEEDDAIRERKIALTEKILEAICGAELPIESVKEIFDGAIEVLMAGKICEHSAKRSALTKTETQGQKDAKSLYRPPDNGRLKRQDDLQLKVMEAVCEAELPMVCVREVLQRVPDSLIPTKIYGCKRDLPMRR